jgi:hypothetical protein
METTTYTVTVTEVGGDVVGTGNVTIGMAVPPEAGISTTDDTICVGESVTMHATILNNEQTISVPPIAIGDILCTDGTVEKVASWPVEGKTAMGIVFYVDNTDEHGWAVHLQDQSTNVSWGGYGTDISSLNNKNTAREALTDLDGHLNTQKIRSAGGIYSYPAAWSVDFNNEWYLPALGQLKQLHVEMVTVNNSLQVVGGTPLYTNTQHYYWSSTEYSQNSSYSVSYFGSVNTTNKNATICYARGIRNF